MPSMYFDIGSNIGKWAIANISQCDKILSIEASPTTFKSLTDNCKHDKIILLNYAVCNNGGKDIAFYEADASTISTINKEWLVNETSRFYNYPYKEITCKTITIDSLIEQYGTPDLIKIDVEGGEYECVSSLTTKVKLLCFEWASETNEITLKCIDYLFNLGYTKFFVQNGDDYVFRPHNDYYQDIITTKNKLMTTLPKHDWGMIWCK
jgi:FkbM family methyltransferase